MTRAAAFPVVGPTSYVATGAPAWEGGAWTPASLTSAVLLGWYDGLDASTLYKAGPALAAIGEDVAIWNDRSGNGRHLAATGAGSSLRAATGLDLTAQRGFTIASWGAVATWEFWFVHDVAGGADGQYVFQQEAGAAPYLLIKSAATGGTYNADPGPNLTSVTAASGSMEIVTLRVNAAGAGAIDINGVEDNAVTSPPALSIAGFTIATNRNDGYGITGILAESLLINDNLIAGDRALLVTYLKAKHGIA